MKEHVSEVLNSWQ